MTLRAPGDRSHGAGRHHEERPVFALLLASMDGTHREPIPRAPQARSDRGAVSRRGLESTPGCLHDLPEVLNRG
jgi:hypothetical protein